MKILNNIKFYGKNKKTAFTLAEVLVSLMVIGIISSIVIPSLNKIKPKESSIMLKKAYMLSGKALNAMLSTTYNDCENGFACKSATDFCKNFASYFNKLTYTEANCNWDSIKLAQNAVHKSFMTTTDGMMWYLNVIGSCQNANNASCAGNGYYYKIIVDLNGSKGPNCSNYKPSNHCKTSGSAFFELNDGTHTCKDAASNTSNVSCDNPDTFMISVNPYGKIEPACGTYAGCSNGSGSRYTIDWNILNSMTKLGN